MKKKPPRNENPRKFKKSPRFPPTLLIKLKIFISFDVVDTLTSVVAKYIDIILRGLSVLSGGRWIKLRSSYICTPTSKVVVLQ